MRVRPSATFVNSIKTSSRILRLFPLSGSQIILDLYSKPYGDIPTGTPFTEASNAGGVGKNNSGRISGYLLMTGGLRTTTTTIHCAVYHIDGDASVNRCLS